MTSTRHRTQAANMDDALAKLQAIIDAAVEAVTPKEADAETVARVKKKCARACGRLGGGGLRACASLHQGAPQTTQTLHRP